MAIDTLWIVLVTVALIMTAVTLADRLIKEPMKDSILASAIVSRFNRLIHEDKTGEVQKLLTQLFESRVEISGSLVHHPTIQCAKASEEGRYEVGMLGVLNGLMGTIPEGHNEGWGYITAIYDDSNQILHFSLTEDTRKPKK